jgi:hypothetical protein
MKGFKWIVSFFRSRVAADIGEVAKDTAYSLASLQADMKVADIIRQLAEAFCKTKSEAVIDTGTLLFVKLRNEHGEFSIRAKRLTTGERMMLNRDATIHNFPSKVAECLGLTTAHTVENLIASSAKEPIFPTSVR